MVSMCRTRSGILTTYQLEPRNLKLETAATVTLKPKRAQPFFARHPWVYAGAIERLDGEPADGAEVDLLSSAGNFIAHGLFNSKNTIPVRLYSWDPGQAPDRDLSRAQI